MAGKEHIRHTAPIFVLGGITGLIIGFYNRINLILSGTLNSMVYYPIANGGGLLLTVSVSILFFREKLTPKMYVGIGVGLLSILLLSIPV